MIRTTIDDAIDRLPELAEAAFRGEEVLITDIKDGNERVLKLVAVPRDAAGTLKRGRPQFGSARGKIWMSEEFDEPLEEAAPFDGDDAQRQGPRKFGSARGEIWMADDFDDPLQECMR